MKRLFSRGPDEFGATARVNVLDTIPIVGSSGGPVIQSARMPGLL
ncbi:hypothetical protein [Streptomyces sp. Je 1-369]|nr:hypothetical protein [Streptomyces sp. Je 1-369]WAL99554.1 hypothetical protein NOO62_36845 [Streptomyces sp. Je 1-369]